MARKARVEFEGADYHVLDRGDRREAIFQDEADRRRFLETLGEACARAGWRVHAFVLMSNHYHLMIETPQANLAAGMRWFQTTWTICFITRNRLVEAHRLLSEGLRCLGMEREELLRLKKGDPRKAALAVRIRTCTAVPNARIAEQLQLGHVSRVNQCARTAPPELLRKLENALGR